ncbi:MAG: class I SAM-dependent methyltransferase, partial [Mesorhizobium sp.]
MSDRRQARTALPCGICPVSGESSDRRQSQCGAGCGLYGRHAGSACQGLRRLGCDLSAEMLKIAGSRQAYSELKQAMLGDPLPWPDGHFRAFFSTGVFTISHAPASGLHELVRITRKGGHAIFTVRDQV